MGSRIAATIILLAGVAFLVWLAVGRGDVETATETAVVAAQVSEPASPVSASPEEASPEAASPEAASPDSASPEAASQPEATNAPAAAEQSIDEPENFGPRMDLVNIDGWLNTEATSIDEFDGKVILVEMWTFGCHNCKARIPHNQSYYEEFQDENFEIVGVHAPDFNYEADVDNIKNALVDLGVDWPIALDTDKKNFRAWQPGSRNFWPRTYVIDQNGDIRYDHIGEGKYEELRETLRYLIENPPAPKPST